ncbi:zinc finger, RING/FYVE/PHD-type [Artemisia annua]|uniref:RING-type E3 ubiquitin transferase n=1 Tax=Artemisia annua TaxID=35608 RepID=A0A2U1NWL1_ARTAN|nr:zinc finger, RING/FYVE/PHD-type [Artemisia annua]
MQKGISLDYVRWKEHGEVCDGEDDVDDGEDDTLIYESDDDINDVYDGEDDTLIDECDDDINDNDLGDMYSNEELEFFAERGSEESDNEVDFEEEMDLFPLNKDEGEELKSYVDAHVEKQKVLGFASFNDVVPVNVNLNNEHVTDLSHNSNNDVDSLPLFKFSSLTGNMISGDCAVCLSKFESEDQLRLLPLCCHAFHAMCIDAWLKSNFTCPLCRSNVNPSEADISRATGAGGSRSNSFRIEIGSISNRREGLGSRRRSYSVGSFEYVVDVDGYEVPVESMRRRGESDGGDKERGRCVAPGGCFPLEVVAGVRMWLMRGLAKRLVSFSGGSLGYNCKLL